MSLNLIPVYSWLQILLYFSVLFALVKPLGSYMAKIYQGEKTFLSFIISPIEGLIYKVSGVKSNEEMDWKNYSLALMIFSFVGFFILYAILRLQGLLILNPANFSGTSPDLAFNTAASFITNTNWQSYGGESTMSYFTQMSGLTVQNFLSAGVGMSVLIALARGFSRKKATTIGNFWVDLVRSNLYILLPLSLTLAILLASQGVIQNFSSYVDAKFIEKQYIEVKEGNKTNIQEVTKQSIALGPVASQVAIKQLGTNGGGFFNTNSAHPFENPTPFSNLLEMLAILLIPAALCYSFGKIVGDTKQGWMILFAMTIIFIPLLLFCTMSEQTANPRFADLNITQINSGNMEGKETRFGIVNSTLWATATTAASNGSVNSMHDSFTPLGGLVPLLLIQFGEVIYGGAGSGLYGMLVFVLISVFIAGLMVGRTPEYLGKKINAFDIKMACIAILVPHLATLIGTAIAVLSPLGKAGILNHYAQGFSEILYAFSSASNNNGSAFAGLSANTPFYNMALGIAMLFGRYWVMLPVLAIAGSFVSKNTVPNSAGTLSTTSTLFMGILISVVVVVGVLTFIPALALGPIAEHFNLYFNK